MLPPLSLRLPAWLTVTALLGQGLALPAQAATVLSGRVTTTDGRPIFGAMVTAFNEDKNRKETAFSDADGRYVLPLSYAGRLPIRVRTPYFKDLTQTVPVKNDGETRADFFTEKLASPEEISESLPASAHVAQLEFPSRAVKETFVSQCNYCHQQGNSLTRQPAPESKWKDTIRRMEGYFANVTYGEVKAIAKTLAEGYTGKPVKAIETYDASPELAQAKIEEWHVGDALSFVHDTFVGDDEKLYGMDEGHDVIWVLDRKTHRIEQLPLPDVGLPQGGRFNGMALPIGVFSGQHGPHSMAQTSDGRLWITASLSGMLFSLDPKTKQFKGYNVPRGFLWHGGLYPHTVRVDKDDMVWFTVVASNQVMRFDPKAEQFTVIDLPSRGIVRWLTDTFFGLVLKIAGLFDRSNLHLALSHHKWLNQGKDVLTMPYGIDVNPKDGSIWYAKLMTSQIGRIDPKTLEVREYDTPMHGPRRPRFDASGMLWIPAFDSGGLMSFDTASRQFSTYPLPRLAPNEYEIPYALNVEQKSGDVWITANNTDRVLRFVPSTGRFISYPMPSRVTFFRDLEFTKDGKICSSNSNLPAYAHEDQVDAFVCIDPNGSGVKLPGTPRT